jgi:hypothetical protein
LFNNKIIIIIVSLIIAAGLIIFGLSNRFYIDTSTHLKVDRFTGKTYRLTNDLWVEVGVGYNSDKNVIAEVQVNTESTGLRFYVEKETEPVISNDEYINNLNLLKSSEAAYNDFKEYYKKVIAGYEKDPLFFKDGGWDETTIEFTRTYKKYSPLLSPLYITETIINHNVKDADAYVNYIIGFYETQKTE